MEGYRKEVKEPSFIVKTSEYIFPVEKDGKIINRHVVVFPELDLLKKTFGDEPKATFSELVKNYSDSEIAERFSNEETQFSTFSIVYTRRVFRLGENKNRSEQGKPIKERIVAMVEAENSGALEKLDPKEKAALILAYYISPHTPTIKEMTRLLGFKNNRETTEFISNSFNKILKSPDNVVE